MPPPAGDARPDAADVDDRRRELRAWLADALTADVRAGLDDPDPDTAFAAHRAWNAALFDAGWAAPAWPARFGGRDAALPEVLAWQEEMARAGAPGPVNAIGVANIAPALMAVGTRAQQDRFLGPMLRGDAIWSQGMSEPEAGSDLASLRCRARRDGDAFVVDGQKTWNSNGHRADWCQLFVRTDRAAPKHQGITCLLVDLHRPGVEARPLRTMAGDTGFAELFFTGVRVPAASVLGGVGDGWAVATRTLGNERAGVAALALHLRRKLDRLLAAGGGSLAPVARDAVAARYVDARVFELLCRRSVDAARSGRPPGPEGSVIKLAWAAAEQRLAATAVDVLGLAALDGPWATALLSSRSLSIAGGTTEVNKTIVADRVLGLPREPPATAAGLRSP